MRQPYLLKYDELEFLNNESVNLHYQHYLNYLSDYNNFVLSSNLCRKLNAFDPEYDYLRSAIKDTFIGQVFNHEFFFESLTDQQTEISEELLNVFKLTFGD